MFNDFTGGPGYPAYAVLQYGWLSLVVGFTGTRVFISRKVLERSKLKIRRRLNKTAPDFRLHIDGVTMYA